MTSKQNINVSENLYIVPVLGQFINTAFHSFSTLRHLTILELARGALNQAGCLPKLVKMDNSPFSVYTLCSIPYRLPISYWLESIWDTGWPKLTFDPYWHDLSCFDSGWFLKVTRPILKYLGLYWPEKIKDTQDQWIVVLVWINLGIKSRLLPRLHKYASFWPRGY